MTRLAAAAATAALLLLSTSASSVVIDLVDGPGSLTWDTSISVTSPADNTDVSHNLFPSNRHPHEGWFIYLPDFDVLHEFTAFTVTSDGASQDSFNSVFTFLGEPLVLGLTYGLTAVGPDGLPDLSWSGTIHRPNNPLSPFPEIDVRLINVFDYDVGDVLGADSATATQPMGATVIEIMGDGGITGQRGAFGPAQYTADTLANVLGQVTGPHLLNDTAAVGNYDVAGAFLWSYTLCSAQGVTPDCSGSGSGTGGFGGFGGFTVVPEPSTAALLLAGLALLVRTRRTRTH